MSPQTYPYNIYGPHQYFSSFILGGYVNRTWQGEGIACRIQITPVDYLKSVWDCFGIQGNIETLDGSYLGTLPTEGGAVQATNAISLGSGIMPDFTAGNGLVQTTGKVKFKYTDTQVFWNSTLQK